MKFFMAAEDAKKHFDDGGIDQISSQASHETIFQTTEHSAASAFVRIFDSVSQPIVLFRWHDLSETATSDWAHFWGYYIAGGSGLLQAYFWRRFWLRRSTILVF
jgi:hypothetical protein